MYVSPFEVEGALATHPDVLETAVVAWADGEALIKPGLRGDEGSDQSRRRGRS